MLINWQTHGGTGPHLLLVHGFLCSAAQWQCNLKGLRAFCQPVTAELLGHGHSAAPAAAQPYHPNAYLECFEQIRTELQASSWFVLGYSMGAGLTLNYTLRYPEHVQGHLFTNSTSAFADAQQQQTLKQHGQEQACRILEHGQSAIEKLAVHPRRASHLRPDIANALLADAERLSPQGVANTLTETVPHISVRAQMQQLRVPGLLLWGTRERRFRPLAKLAIEHMPKLRSVELDAGHGVNMESPTQFNQQVAEFLDQCHTS